jgi:7,8-dihydropterin-6-yl-methyl-4-(beta-D-ribofuranosyl)aminobenzene 5'-phosphate synthase
MKSKNFLKVIFNFLLVCGNIYPQESQLSSQEKSALLKAIEEDNIFAEWVKDTSNAIKLYEQYKADLKYSDSLWDSDQRRTEKIKDFGYTNKFELIPLIENLSGKPEFKKGIGVSYLIRTDHSTILFDTGWDDDSVMCAFRYNLDMLGIDIKEIDAVVISHNHGDHQNEWKWISDKTFVNSKSENILSHIKIYIPDKTLKLKIATQYSYDPVKISEGVYTTGIIRAPLFFSPIEEQSLIFNVKDKGIIILTGCGHPGVEKLLARSEKLTKLPLFGILGGLHFPIDGDSEKYMGYFISGKLPWEKFTLVNVDQKIKMIKEQRLKLIGVSTHDSSDKAIRAFKTAFPTEYKDLMTGEWITIK